MNIKKKGGLEVSLQSFPTLAIGRSEREFAHHIRLSSGKELSVSIEQEIGWKTELVYSLKGNKHFIPVGNPTKIPQIFSPQPTQSLYSLSTLIRCCNKLDF
jgi:hypothetical protein